MCDRGAGADSVWTEPACGDVTELDPIVVKIGGSVARSGSALKQVLGVLEQARRPMAVVAGGGSLADGVRQIQPTLGIADKTAHRMALLSLHQMALIFHEFAPCLRALTAASDIERNAASGNSAIWLPYDECRDDPLLPANWEATSDAVAARLAERLSWPIVFVKSRAPHGEFAGPNDLARDGLIDPVSATILERSRLRFRIIERCNLDALSQCLGAPEAANT